ncbi:MAG TPA: peptidoglycan-binding domain-containing protein [Gaiellaceae bacterium]|nr:peptidoglycan-binding domain-containing protein [Gaiellaceae bacterium]
MPWPTDGRRLRWSLPLRSEGRRDRAWEARHWLHRENVDKNETILLEEYKTLRSEVTTSMQSQQSTLTFGSATLGILFAAASQASNTAFRDMLLLVFVPFLSYLVLTIWLAEVLRMMRAGMFLMRIEKRLDEQHGIGALTWESTVFHGRFGRGPGALLHDPDRFRTLAITLLFLAVAGVAIVMGWDAAPGFSWQRIVAVAGAATCLLVLLWLGWLRRQQMDQLLLPVLRRGAQGEAIDRLQRCLRRHGFDPGAEEAFGEATEQAVREFQRSRKIEPDGVVGIMTWARLLEPAEEAGSGAGALVKLLHPSG